MNIITFMAVCFLCKSSQIIILKNARIAFMAFLEKTSEVGCLPYLYITTSACNISDLQASISQDNP